VKKLLIIGAGGHGRSVAEAVNQGAEFELAGFVDDSFPINQVVWSYKIYGDTTELSQYREVADWVIVAIGNNRARQSLTDRFILAGFSVAKVIHPAAMVSPSAIVGAGSTIMAGAIVGTESTLGAGVIVNCGATIDHHCTVENFGHLGVNACMAGGSRMGEGAWLQAGSALGYGVTIPAGTVVVPGTGISSITV
jgi:sugar O-acyltransferase (sialic acid O-acetyltransferase NeuD family)